MTDRIRELLAIMSRLRAPDGCPWDRQQSFASIAPYTIEEAYEVADAIERGDLDNLRDELGDLLFQVVFHAQLASDISAFNFDDVVSAICDKLTRRHPHVFGSEAPVSAAMQSVTWENVKAAERTARNEVAGHAVAGHLDGVPHALPALLRAHKLSKRAARVGFDFEQAAQTADKVAEELAEVRGAMAESFDSGATAHIFEEVGDLLFAVANLARKLEVDAEAALRAANKKFERRFAGMEALAAQRGEVFADLDLIAQERLWQVVKRGE